MFELLKDLRIIEVSSFIAAPSCGLYLSQFGAEVIRVEAIGGGPDYGRWPLAPGGTSLYWEGLNKGKKSVAIDLSSPEGREILYALAAAPGDGGGIVLTNLPPAGFLSHERLRARREDMVVVRVMGRSDGGTAVDYTVNSAFGVPLITGPASLGEEPVNHVLPAWDLLTGAYSAFTLLAALRYRQATGSGQEVRIPLDDVAIASLGHLGQIAETAISGSDRPRFGNDLFGAFGRDFLTADRMRVMVVAITERQWSGLVAALSIEAPVARLEEEAGVSFARDEGERFRHRERLDGIVAEAIAARPFDEIARAFDANGVCWGPYRTLSQALDADPRLSTRNPILSMVRHPSGSSYLTPGAAATLSGAQRQAPRPAPRLGEHTESVLGDVLGLPAHRIADLRQRRVIASAGGQG